MRKTFLRLFAVMILSGQVVLSYPTAVVHANSTDPTNPDACNVDGSSSFNQYVESGAVNSDGTISCPTPKNVNSVTGSTTDSKTNCTIGNKPFTLPRSGEPDATTGIYTPLTGAIWREGYGNGDTLSPTQKGPSGTSSAGTGNIMDEWEGRLISAITSYGSNPDKTSYSFNPASLMWADAAGDLVAPDILAAAIGFTWSGKSWVRTSTSSVQARVDAILAATLNQEIRKTGTLTPWEREGTVGATLSPVDASYVPVSGQSFSGGNLNSTTILAMLNSAEGTRGWTWADWHNILAPSIGADLASTWGPAAPTLWGGAVVGPVGGSLSYGAGAGINGATITWTVWTWTKVADPTPKPKPTPTSCGEVWCAGQPTPTPSPTPVTTYHGEWYGTTKTLSVSAKTLSYNQNLTFHTSVPAAKDRVYGSTTYDSVPKVSFELDIPNRVRYITSTWSTGGKNSVEAMLNGYIASQLATPVGEFYWLPVFMAPIDGSKAVTCVTDDFYIYGMHVKALDSNRGDCQLPSVFNQADYDSYINTFNEAGAASCFIGWYAFITPLPKINPFTDLSGVLYNTVAMKSQPAVPIVNQPTTFNIDTQAGLSHKLTAMGQNSDTTWPAFKNYWLQWNITQPALSITVGDGTHGILKACQTCQIVPELIFPRNPDPNNSTGGYNGISVVFARTPLSVMQDASCVKAFNSGGLASLDASCGVTLMDTGGGRIEPVFDVHVKTWYTGVYAYKGSDFRGAFNPWWATLKDPYVCANTVPWSDGPFAAAGIQNTAWGRVDVTVDGISARKSIDARNKSNPSDVVTTWPTPRTLLGRSTPPGDVNPTRPPNMSCSGYSQIPVNSKGTDVYQPYMSLYLPVAQVQSVG